MPTLNYTTTIAAAKTIGECQTLLAKHVYAAFVHREQAAIEAAS